MDMLYFFSSFILQCLNFVRQVPPIFYGYFPYNSYYTLWDVSFWWDIYSNTITTSSTKSFSRVAVRLRLTAIIRLVEYWSTITSVPRVKVIIAALVVSSQFSYSHECELMLLLWSQLTGSSHCLSMWYYHPWNHSSQSLLCHGNN